MIDRKVLREPTDEFTTEDHEQLLKNKEAEKLSDYMAYKQLAKALGPEKAMYYLGLKKPPKEPC